MAGEDRDVAAEPKRRIRRKTVLVLAGGLTAVVLLLLFLCHFVGIRSTSDVIAYREMRREQFPPIWKALALRRIKRGDKVETLLARHTPLRHEEAPPYARLVYIEGGHYPGLTVIAKEGRLLAAAAGAATWQHVFFDAPEQMERFAEAQLNFMHHWELEADAYRVHRAITCGQDVFLSQRVESSAVPDTSPATQEMIQELREIYGARKIGISMRLERIIEVNEVLFGDLEPGTTLTLAEEQCRQIDLTEPETVFLYFDEGRMVYPAGKAEPLCLTVPKRALDWYESLTPDQVQALDSRCAGKLSRWRPRRGH